MPQLKRQIPNDGAIVPGYNANADIGAKLLVKYGASGALGAGSDNAVTIAGAATDKFVGVTMEIIPQLSVRNVQREGMGICIAGTAGVARGDRITAEAGGAGIKTVTTGHSVAGIAETDAVAGGDFQIRLTPGAVVP